MTVYKTTIGIECHVQLNTRTKLFGPANNDARSAEPNTTVDEVCFGLPGVLPVLNEAVIELAIKAGRALNAEVATFSKFDRKHYFYPDLPKGYQITQFDQPTVGKGSIAVPLNGELFNVGITRAHLEEDAGKLVHHGSQPVSLVDLNRAGTPLLEIVSDPDIHSPAEARAFAEELQRLMRYADVTYGNLFHGNMRFDVNVSIAPEGVTELGTRSEVKNLNSFRSVERAAAYEIVRQTKLLEDGKEVIQETRGWDDDALETFSQRGKENAHDYRYFPEPDVPPIVLEQDYIDEVQGRVVLLPEMVRSSLEDMKIDDSVKQVIVDEPELARMYMAIHDNGLIDEKATRTATMWISNDIAQQLNGDTDEPLKVSAELLSELAQMFADEKISSSGAKTVLAEMLQSGGSPGDIAQKTNLLQVNDDGAIKEIVQKIIDDNPKVVQDIIDGQDKAIGFLVGQVMKLSKGSANPAKAQALIKELIKEA